MIDQEKPRLSRLTSIITELQSKRMVTTKQLADRHKVSVRTIYRDIRTLEQSGVPIFTEEGKGYSLMEGYRLPPVLFSEEEANALITAEQIIRRSKDQSLVDQYSSAITKIKSVLQQSAKGKADLLAERVAVGEALQEEKTSDNLMKIQSALTNFQMLKIQYMSLKGKASERQIEPFALYSTNGNWLLIAFCRLRNEFRVFRIDYIQRIVSLSEKFTPHSMTLEKYFELYIKK